MTKLKAVILMSVVMFFSPLIQAKNPPSPTGPTLYEQQLDHLLTRLIEVTAVPAFSVAVVHKGELVAAVAVGHADTEKNQLATPEHLFRLASVSKVVGATMLAELVLQQKLNPDFPIGKYYPELNKKYHSITLRQLLAHTSGMPHYQVIDSDIYDKHYHSAVAAAETLKGRSLRSLPGEEYYYSTHGFTLAGAIYEKITEQPLSLSLPEFIRLLTGKTTPTIENINALDPMSVSLYERSGSRMLKEKFGEKSYSVFGAGLAATATDLAYFGSQVLSKSRLSQSYQRLLFSPATGNSGQLTGNDSFQVGFGWRTGKSDTGRTVYHHAGATPGARSVIVLYPDEDLSITLLSNSSWTSSIEKTADALVELYLSGAKPKQLNEQTNYTMSYDSTTFSGFINCKNNDCYLMDDKSALADWLNKFNPTKQEVSKWPVFSYQSGQGGRLIMVSKVGFIDLNSTPDSGEYSGLVSGRKKISMKLYSQQ